MPGNATIPSLLIQKRDTTAVKLLKTLKEEMRHAVETALAVPMAWIGVVAAGWVLSEKGEGAMAWCAYSAPQTGMTV